jgi:hypothetical protein
MKTLITIMYNLLQIYIYIYLLYWILCKFDCLYHINLIELLYLNIENSKFFYIN